MRAACPAREFEEERGRGGGGVELKAAFHGPSRHGAKGNWAEIIKIADRDTDTKPRQISCLLLRSHAVFVFFKITRDCGKSES